MGLSQGFIEPLEATALYLVQQTAEIFVEGYEKGNFSNQHCAAFNQRISEYFEGIRDYYAKHGWFFSALPIKFWWSSPSIRIDEIVVFELNQLL